ncbi:MAG: acyl-ACP desaturase [Acidimicrobiia bacterium]|nr:acyl-ACP desaturase [Acidimicrobiia bacterium]
MVIEADLALLADIEPEAERLLERHLSSTKAWHPHTLVPWSRGRDFEPDYEWDPDETTIPAEVRAALFVNLLTEDNLPYYFRDIERMLGKTGAFGEWTRRWTAEEARHATVIRDYLTITRVVDPTALENARMVQMSGGVVPQPPTAADGLIYVTLQELATRISHRNTGTRIEEHDRVGHDIMRRVANDENHHFLFYRDMAQAIVDARPSEAVLAMERQVIGFAMPGEGIPDFNALARMIAAAGIYDLALHHEKILEPIVLQYWGLPDLEGLTPEAEQSRERTLTYIEKSARVARRLRERREARESSLVDA